MPHNEYLIFDRDKFTQCLGFYTRLYTGILRCLFSLSTIIGNTVTVLDHSLVAASCKCEIDRYTSIVITLCIRIGTQSQTDTKCCRNSISDIYGLYIIQQGELIFFQLFKIRLSDDNEILIILQLLDDSVNFCNILVDLTVYQSHQK